MRPDIFGATHIRRNPQLVIHTVNKPANICSSFDRTESVPLPGHLNVPMTGSRVLYGWCVAPYKGYLAKLAGLGINST